VVSVEVVIIDIVINLRIIMVSIEVVIVDAIVNLTSSFVAWSIDCSVGSSSAPSISGAAWPMLVYSIVKTLSPLPGSPLSPSVP
jgi:hypothetical protein